MSEKKKFLLSIMCQLVLIGCVVFMFFVSGDLQKQLSVKDEVISDQYQQIEYWKSNVETNKSVVYMPVKFTYDELDLLARLVHAEAGGESFDTKMKVASVVMNRVASDKFPNTIKDVIYQTNQFEVCVIKINGKYMIDNEADSDSMRAAYEVLVNGSVLPSSVLVFYGSECDEGWVRSRTVYGTSDKTVFAYLH